jgi:hypothetical protein
MKTTTLNRIRAHNPCTSGWKKLLVHLGKTEADDEPLGFDVILKSNGLSDALWCLRAEPQYEKEYRMLAVAYARQVQHLMTDPRSVFVVNTAERFVQGKASERDLEEANEEPCNAAFIAGDNAATAAYYANAYTTAEAARLDEKEIQTKQFLKMIEDN